VAGDQTQRRGTRWYDRGLFWLAVVGVGVAGALGASFLAERRTGDDEPPLEPETFCNTAAELAGFDEIEVEVGVDVDALRRLQTVVLKLATLAPGSVAEDFSDVADGLGEVIGVAQAVPSDDPEGLATVVAALDEQGAATAAASDRAAAYVERWCGFDPNEPGPPGGAPSGEVPGAAPDTTAPATLEAPSPADEPPGG
jgi:hypothetical protein